MFADMLSLTARLAIFAAGSACFGGSPPFLSDTTNFLVSNLVMLDNSLTPGRHI